MAIEYQKISNKAVKEYITIKEILDTRITRKKLQARIVNKSNIFKTKTGNSVFNVLLKDTNNNIIKMVFWNDENVKKHYLKLNVYNIYEISNYCIQKSKEKFEYRVKPYNLICQNNTVLKYIKNFSCIINNQLCVQLNRTDYQPNITNFCVQQKINVSNKHKKDNDKTDAKNQLEYFLENN